MSGHEWERDAEGNLVVRDIGPEGYHEDMITCTRCGESRCAACVDVRREPEECDG